jgi:hypothetical protein
MFWRDHSRQDELAIIARIIIESKEEIMASLDDIKTAQDATDANLATLKANVEGKLAALADALAKLSSGTLTAEQQAAVDAAVAHANSINDSVSQLVAQTA